MTAHPYTPAVHPDEDDHPAHAPLDRLACPACGVRAATFWRSWVAGSLLRPRCPGCGARLVVVKDGALRFAGVVIGTVLGGALILNTLAALVPWWAFAVGCALGFALDAWCDARSVRLEIRRGPESSARGG